MKSGKIAAIVGACLLAVAAPAKADHWMQTADPQVLSALNQLGSAFGQLCQRGNQQYCMAYNQLDMHGRQMLNAGYECQVNGNQQACWFYQESYNGLSQTWAAYQQGIANAQASAGQSPMAGMNHQQRQQFLQNNFNRIMEQGRQNSQLLDQRHQQWLNAQ